MRNDSPLAVGEEFDLVSSYLNSWPEGPVPACSTPHLRRLVACCEVSRSDGVGWADIAVLVRQALRVGRTVGGGAPWLSVPSGGPDSGGPWPTPDQWRRAGVLATPVAGGRLRVQASPWTPAWLPSERPVDERVSTAPFDEGYVRHHDPVRADPFVRHVFPHAKVDYSTYTSTSHKEAVRAVWACQPGATALINLPTGAGKSTVAFAPIFSSDGVSIFVVPTVALAIDQERRLQRELLCDDSISFAYSGDTPEDERAAIRARIRDGSQRVVIVSPEALTRSLVPSLFDAASKGLLRYFVVDEAHLVDQWGSEFRPEFQAMAGLRTELLKTQKAAGVPGFRTVLMSATMPAPTIDLLLQLFGDPGPVEILVATVLRPEPEYWSAECHDDDERDARLVEALLHLPRPAIVYVTQPVVADRLTAKLERDGFQRIRSFSGLTKADERREVLKRFRDDAVDLVVATSAFGLGVDQSDVRAVIHATVPETIDRFYQEVGRGGRDGRASISLVCWTQLDLATAKSMSQNRYIGEELGLARWSTMIKRAKQVGHRYDLPLSELRTGLEFRGDENERWNVRTLGLLIRAGLLAPRWAEPEWHPSAGEERQLAHDESRQNAPSLKIAIEINEAVNEDSWAARVEPVRRSATNAAATAHELMRAALRPGSAVCDIVASAYGLGTSTRIPQPAPSPTVQCGGCAGHAAPRYWAPASPPLHLSAYGDGGHGQFSRWLDFLGRECFYDAPQTQRDRQRLMRQIAEALPGLVRHGVRRIVGLPSVLDDVEVAKALASLHLAASDRFVFVEPLARFEQYSLIGLPSLPTVVLFDPEQDVVPSTWVSAETDTTDDAEPTLLLLSLSVRDPHRPDRTLRSSHPNARTLQQFMTGLGL